MAKAKRRSRRKDAKKDRSPGRQGEQDRQKAANRPAAKPPQPNRPMLIVSAVLMAAWLIFLLVVALVG